MVDLGEGAEGGRKESRIIVTNGKEVRNLG